MKILLPIDGSDCSTRTVKWAAETFNKETTRYYVLYVIPAYYNEIKLVEYDMPTAKALLNKTESFLKEQGCQVEKSEFMEGDPVSLICGYAEEMQVDQVVIGSHGRTGFKKLLLGSVSIAVMEQCKRPVSVYRNVEPRPAIPHLLPSGTVL